MSNKELFDEIEAKIRANMSNLITDEEIVEDDEDDEDGFDIDTLDDLDE
jgi:hypothetical protein